MSIIMVKVPLRSTQISIKFHFLITLLVLTQINYGRTAQIPGCRTVTATDLIFQLNYKRRKF